MVSVVTGCVTLAVFLFSVSERFVELFSSKCSSKVSVSLPLLVTTLSASVLLSRSSTPLGADSALFWISNSDDTLWEPRNCCSVSVCSCVFCTTSLIVS